MRSASAKSILNQMVLYKCIMAEAGATEQIIMNVQHLSDWHFMRFVRLALGTYIEYKPIKRRVFFQHF
jgi:hypothetical protein